MQRRFVIAAACALIACSTLPGAVQRGKQSVQPARHSLTIDGQSFGSVKSVRGGAAYADVVIEAKGPEGAASKRPGPPRFEDLTVELPVASQPVQQLISAMWQGKAVPQNGSLVASDSTGKSISELQFTNGIVTEVTLPACDAASKEQGHFAISFSPEMLRTLKGSGATTAAQAKADQKAWQVSAYRLQIDGMDCTRVSRIDPLIVKAPIVSAEVGTERQPQKQSAGLEFGNLRITLNEATAPAWQQWFDELVIQGKSNLEKNGSLILLGPDLKTELAVINFSNLGIIRIGSTAAEANAERPPQTVVEMYCESMNLAGPGGAQKTTASTPSAQPPTEQQAAAPDQAPVPSPRDRTAVLQRPSGRTQPQPPEQPAAVGGGEVFRVEANPKLPAGMGRLVVRFPEGTLGREEQRVQFPKDREDVAAAVEFGSVAKEVAPGEYIVILNNRLVEAVKVEAGADTHLIVGTLRVIPPENTTFEVVEEDLDSAPVLVWNSATRDYALPTGKYFVRVNRQMFPVTVEPGKVTEFKIPSGSR